MRIQTDHYHFGKDSNLRQEDTQVALSPPRKSVPLRTDADAPSSPQKKYRSDPYAAYSFQNAGRYNQAIRAYQESARYEPGHTVPIQSIGNISEDIRGNEKALTEILREEPGNSSAWYDLGIIYSERGNREKVSAVYQVLQKIDEAMADGFSTQLGLHEKMLLDVV
jgi:tetratricopeptide (TPR) repeat protein